MTFYIAKIILSINLMLNVKQQYKQVRINRLHYTKDI